MNTVCKSFEPLIPSYLDGELSDAQAGPLRRHVLECPACRRRVSGDKALKRWFVAEPAPAVPAGFAERVARRAFAGDTGADTGAAEAPLATAEGNGKLLRFVLAFTAVAAAVLLIVASSLPTIGVPISGTLEAEDDVPMKLEQVLNQLGELERAEAAALAEAAEAARARRGDTRGAAQK